MATYNFKCRLHPVLPELANIEIRPTEIVLYCARCDIKDKISAKVLTKVMNIPVENAMVKSFLSDTPFGDLLDYFRDELGEDFPFVVYVHT